MHMVGPRKRFMANFPFVNYTIPSADPPYPVIIRRNGEAVLETDNCGRAFVLKGDKHSIAVALLEHAMDNVARVSSPLSFNHREGAFDFIVKDKKIVDCQHYFTERIFGPSCPSLVEKRSEIFEIIEIIKSLLKMKVFL